MVICRPQVNKEKYKQVILFLLNSAVNNNLLGKVKLFKLLYYIDFNHYQTFKMPVTGDIYRKLPYGPVGDNVVSILSEMVKGIPLFPFRLVPLYFRRPRNTINPGCDGISRSALTAPRGSLHAQSKGNYS